MRLLLTGLLTSASLMAATAASAATGMDAQHLSAQVIATRYLVCPSFSKSPVVFSGKEDSRFHVQSDFTQLGLGKFAVSVESLGAKREASHKKSPQEFLMMRGLGTGSGEGAPSGKSLSASKRDETVRGRAVAFDGSSAAISSPEAGFSVASGSARHQGSSFTQPIPIQTIVGDAARQGYSSPSSPHSASGQNLQGNGDVMSPRGSYAEGGSSRESGFTSPRGGGLATQESFGIPDAPPPPSDEELARATEENLAKQGKSLPVRVGSAARGSGAVREGNENGLLFQIEKALSRLNHVNTIPLKPSRTAHGVTREQLIEQRKHLRKTLTTIADHLRNASHNGSTVSASDLADFQRVLASLSTGKAQVNAAALDQLRILVDKLSVLPVAVASVNGSGQGNQEPSPTLNTSGAVDEPSGPLDIPLPPSDVPPPPPDAPDPSLLTRSSSPSRARGTDGRMQLDASVFQAALTKMRNKNTPQDSGNETQQHYFAAIPQEFKNRFSANGLKSLERDKELVRKLALLTSAQWITLNGKISGFVSPRTFYMDIRNEPWLKALVVEERAASTTTGGQSGTAQDPRLSTLVGKDKDIIALLPFVRQKNFLDGPAKVAALRILSEGEKDALIRNLRGEDSLRRYSVLMIVPTLRAADERDALARSSATRLPGNGQSGLQVATGPRFQRQPAATPESLQLQIAALTAENATSQNRIEELEVDRTRRSTDPGFNTKNINDEIERLKNLKLKNQNTIGEKTRYRERLLSRARLTQSATQSTGSAVVVPLGSAGAQTAAVTPEQVQAAELEELRVTLGSAAPILDLLRPQDRLWIKGKTILLNTQTGVSRVAAETRKSLVDWLRGLNPYQIRDLRYLLEDKQNLVERRARLTDKSIYDFIQGRHTSATPYADEVAAQLMRQQGSTGSAQRRQLNPQTQQQQDDDHTG